MTTVLSDIVRQTRRREFASLEAEREYAAAKDALNAEAKENWGNPVWHREQAAVIAETLDYGFRFDNSFGAWFPTRFVGETDQIVVRERRGLKVFYTHRAGEIDESTLSTDVWELPKDTMGWHLSEFEDNVRNGYAETIEELVPLAREREDAEINRRIFTLIQEAIPPSSPYYVDAVASGLTEAVLRDALNEVSDQPRPSNGNLVRSLAVVGRKSALAPILDFASYSDVTKDAIARTGRLGGYFGADIIELENYQDEDGLPYITDDEVYVVGGNLGLFGVFGGSRVKQWAEDKVDYHHFKSRRDVGGAVYRPQFARRIKVA